MKHTFISDELLTEYYRKKDELIQVESLIYNNLNSFFHILHFSYFYEGTQLPAAIETLTLNHNDVIEIYKARNIIQPGICTFTKFKIIAASAESNNRTIMLNKDILYRNENIIIFQMCEPVELNLFSLYKK
jgi:hypothetical protein